MLTPVYNGTVEFAKVDVDDGGLYSRVATLVQGPTAVTVGNDIRFPVGSPIPDFSQGSPSQQQWLVHEVAHVYQYQRNPDYSAIGALMDRNYAYTINPAKTLNDYGWERQADILADYSRLLGNQSLNASSIAAYDQVISAYGLGASPALGPGVLNPPFEGGGGNPYVPGFASIGYASSSGSGYRAYLK